MSHLAAKESMVLTLTIEEDCPAAAEAAAPNRSRTSDTSTANETQAGVKRTLRVARTIS
jgi:hypothetical protein